MVALRADVGDIVTLSASFTDDADDPIDPSTLTLTVVRPDRTVFVTATTGFGNEDPGEYTYPVEPDQHGRWHWKWVATGAATAADEGVFDVRRPRVP